MEQATDTGALPPDPHKEQLSTPDFFGVFDNALSGDFCRNVIERFEADPRKIRGQVGEGHYRPDIKGTTEIDFHETPDGWEDVVAAMTQNVRHHLGLYMRRFQRAFQAVNVTHEGFRMARYNPGEQFRWHSDNIGSTLSRVITAQWFLNTVEEGGATEFLWQGRAIEPREGRLMLAPVGWTFYHRGAPPVSGPKYIIITQLHQVRRKAPAGNGQETSETGT